MTGRYNSEHRVARRIYEKYAQRKLSILECVHHIDGNPCNNNPNNLKVMTREEHSSLHHAGRRKGKIMISTGNSPITATPDMELLEGYTSTGTFIGGIVV